MSEPINSKSLPATQAMIYELRSELKSDIAGLSLNMDARFKKMDARFKSMDARFKSIDAQFLELRAEIKTLTAISHRTLALVEEQNNKNNIVLDGYKLLYDRIERLEKTKADKIDLV